MRILPLLIALADGNTVMVVGASGLIVVDTGRHSWHSDGILAFARSRRLPVVAIVNTHWHWITRAATSA